MDGFPSTSCRDLGIIYEAAVRAVEPARLVRTWLADHRPLLRSGPFRGRSGESGTVVGFGKAAVGMAAGCEAALGPAAANGIVIVPARGAGELTSIRIAGAAHPTPDERCLAATTEVCRLLDTAITGPILCLISGGASSLLVRPRPPLVLADKRRTTEVLLTSGAAIGEINAVRKHLSEVKGGGLLRFIRSRPVVSLILSDVVGDDPAVIGSGPTAPDSTTFADAMGVLERYGVATRVPAAVRALIERGMRGEVPETIKRGDPLLGGVSNVLVGTNRTALEGAAEAARRLGYRTTVLERPLTGDTAARARVWLAEVSMEMERAGPRPACVIAGGETTVTVHGRGRGGRNQEFALALVSPLAESPISVLSAGTDGIDGPTDAAGACVDGTTLQRARAAGLDPERFLLDNDSYSFFAALGDLFSPGATGTNVMDIKIAVRHPSSPLPEPCGTGLKTC